MMLGSVTNIVHGSCAVTGLGCSGDWHGLGWNKGTVTDAVHTEGEPTAGPDTTGADTSDVYKTPPKPATGPTCIGFLNNCECPCCHNESRETTPMASRSRTPKG